MAGSKAPRMDVQDFMPQFRKEVVQQSAQEMMQRIHAAVGAKAFTKKGPS